MAKIEDGGNYGDFLLKTIDGIKDQFSADELKLLNEGAEEIKEIEGKLTLLEQKFPGCGEKPSDGDMSVPAENGKPIARTFNFKSVFLDFVSEKIKHIVKR